MIDLVLQALTCVPIWCVAALFLAAFLAYRTSGKPSHRHWRDLSVVLVFLVLTSFIWANPITAFRDSGPFHGRVIDKDSGGPIANAAIGFAWTGIRSQTSAWSLTNDQGEFTLPWQGLRNWRVGAWPNPAAVVVSAPGYASGRFWQNGKPLESGGSPPSGSERASFNRWTMKLPRLQPGVQLYSPLWDDWMAGMEKVLPSGPTQIYARAYQSACVDGRAQNRVTTDLEFQQIRAWGIVSGNYKAVANDKVIENVVSHLGGTQLDWNGLEVITPKAVPTTNVEEVCRALADKTGGKPL